MSQPSQEAATARARAVRRDEYRTLSVTLGRAFHDDPVAEFFFPDEATRVGRYAAFTRFAMDMLAPAGRFLTVDPEQAGALWQAPSPPKRTAWKTLVSAVRMAAVARSAFTRIAAMGEATEPWHPHEPHWYLAVLGTAPEQQGRGLGSELLRETLAECDRTGTLAYLESSKEQNLPFYERHGFRVDGEFPLPGSGPTIWAMRRRPA